MKLLKRVKSKLFIPSYRKAVSILEGQYIAVSNGRSIDFDDLRDYDPSTDTIRDIDWRATARNDTPLVKRYIASRKKPVTFIVDCGRGMEALSATGYRKKDVAIQVVGLLGYLAVKHNDTVGLLYGNSITSKLMPGRESEGYLERLLQVINNVTNLQAPVSDIVGQIRLAVSTLRQRGIVVIVSGEFDITPELKPLVQQLKKKHDVMWVVVRDGDPLEVLDLETDVEDIETFELIPDFIRKDSKLRNWFATSETVRVQGMQKFMSDNMVTYCDVNGVDEVLPKLTGLLEKKLRERRA